MRISRIISVQLNWIIFFSEEDTMLGEWLEKQEDPMSDQDPEFEQLIEELIGDRPEPMRALERVRNKFDNATEAHP